MIYLLFLIGLASFSLGIFATYSEWVRESGYLAILGTCTSVISTAAWFQVVKLLEDNQKIYVYGLVWDGLAFFPFVLIPVLFYGTKLSWNLVLGTVFVIVGLFLSRI